MSVYIPVYCRPPNNLIIYYYKAFDDGMGHKGIEKVALYHDKNKKQKEMIAQILWE